MPTPRDTLAILREIRERSGQRASPGLPDDVIRRFAVGDVLLRRAVSEAAECHHRFRRELPHLAGLDEAEQVRELQRGYLNFYPRDLVNPYVAPCRPRTLGRDFRGRRDSRFGRIRHARARDTGPGRSWTP